MVNSGGKQQSLVQDNGRASGLDKMEAGYIHTGLEFCYQDFFFFQARLVSKYNFLSGPFEPEHSHMKES